MLAHVAAPGACSEAKGGTLPTQQGRRRREPPHLGRGAGTHADRQNQSRRPAWGVSPLVYLPPVCYNVNICL